MATTTLHVTNGDGAADLIKASAITGDVLPWRDPMHQGPFPKATSLTETSVVRARYLAGDVFDLTQTQNDFIARDNALQNASASARVVLWFEHDLLDQLQLLQILDHFHQAEIPPEALELICIDQFDGIEPFRGLGQLTAEQITTLYPDITSVTTAQLALASDLWGLFCNPDPAGLLQWLQQGDHQTLPFMHRALQRHVEEYPWQHDGLSRTERQLLTLLSKETLTAGKLFVANMEKENALYIGDWNTYSTIERLATATKPLVRGSNGDYQTWTRKNAETFTQQTLALTATGEQVLANKINAHGLIDRDYWLGGIHLMKDGWQWDDRQQTLTT